MKFDGGAICFGRKGSNGDDFVIAPGGWLSAGVAKPFPDENGIFLGLTVQAEPAGDKGVDYSDV